MHNSLWIDTDTIEEDRENATFSGAPAPVAKPTREALPPGNPELVDKLRDLLESLSTNGSTIESRLCALEQDYSNATYAELIYLLSHLRFPPDEARNHWIRILEHREEMQGRLGAPLDLRVALISYFLEVNRELRNPKIIEMQLFDRTHESASRDGLTGLYNYRALREHLAREIYQAERTGAPLTLVLLDIDDFECFNDANGHDAGNKALMRIAGLLTDSLRKGDIAARYDGEEFALILTSTPKPEAIKVAERIREAVENQSFSGEVITVSLGVATFPADAPNGAELIKKADRAVYVSKSAGKNQSTLYGKSQRSHGRVEVELSGDYRVISDEPRSLTAVNISEAGVLFEANQRLLIDSLIEVRLNLEGSSATLSGRVVHVLEAGEQFFIALRFVDGSSMDRLLLGRFVRAQLVAR